MSRSNPIDKRLQGYREFAAAYFGAPSELSKRLSQGQEPKILFVSCSDSRVDPGILTQAQPGDLFMVRNVANIVPPASAPDGTHGVSAAAEYAVCHLHVEHIVVMGHSQCGGIGALVDGAGSEGAPSYITSWMALMTDVVQRLEAEGGRAWPTAKQRAFCEREALKLSLDNLHTYSWVNERVDSGQLALHAWHYDLVSGGLQGLDPTTGTFVDLVEGTDVVHA